jgi:uncharacterized metal-binding protein YceD (DUF177 family)
LNKPLRLQIPLDEIPDPGLRIEGDLPESWIAKSLLPAYTPRAPMAVEIDLRRMGDNVLISGELRFGLTFTCSRSGASGTSDLEVSLSELFQPVGSHTLNLGEADVSSDDLGSDEPFLYEGRQIDLEPYLREQLVLAQDPFPTRSDAEEPVQGSATWSSRGDEIDPRWEKLKALELS